MSQAIMADGIATRMPQSVLVTTSVSLNILHSHYEPTNQNNAMFGEDCLYKF